MVEWPAEEGALYTLVLSNLDINTRENRFAFVIFHWTSGRQIYVSSYYGDQHILLREPNHYSWQDTVWVLALVCGQHTWRLGRRWRSRQSCHNHFSSNAFYSQVIFDLLFPLVLPEGDGNHRFGYFVMKQVLMSLSFDVWSDYHTLHLSHTLWTTDWREAPQTLAAQTWVKVVGQEGRKSWSNLDYQSSGWLRSIKELIRKYDLELTASTFLIMDADQASLEIACQWQRCMGGQVLDVTLKTFIKSPLQL